MSEISTLQVNKQQLINSIAHLKGQQQQALDHVNTFKAWLKAAGIDPNRSPVSISLQALLDHSDPALFNLEPASTEIDVILPEF